MLEQGKTQEGLALLVHAGRIDPENPVIATRLLSTLTTRNFAQPLGSTLQLPARPHEVSGSSSVTHDGRLLGFFGQDNVFRLVDIESGRVEHEISLPSGSNRLFLWGNTVYVVGNDRNWVEHYHAGSGQKLSRIENIIGWSGGAMSDDGGFLGLWYPNAIRVWNAVSGQLCANLPLESPPDRVYISADGARAAIIYDDRRFARIWSLTDGAPISQPLEAPPKRKFAGGRLSHNGRLFALMQEEGVQLHDMATGRPLGPFLSHEGLTYGSTSPVFTPDDALLITASSDRAAKVWNVSTGQLALAPLMHGGKIQTPRVVGDGRFLFTLAGDDFARLWDLTTGQLVIEPMRQVEGGILAASLDGKQLVQIFPNGTLSHYRIEASSARPLALPVTDEMLGIQWEADRPATVRQVEKRRLIRVDVATGREVGVVNFPEPISAQTPSADGRVMLVTTQSGARQAWMLSAEGIKVTPLADFPNGRVVATRVNADGGLAIVIEGGTAAKEMRVWDLRAGTPVGAALNYESPLFNGSGNGSFSPDGRRVAAGSVVGEAKVWEVATSRLVHALKLPRGTIRRVEFSPDGTRIATVDLRTGARLWDATTGEPVGGLMKHRGGIGGGISPAGFSKDGRWLMTYSQQAGTVAVWDAHTGAPVGAQIEHANGIATPVFSPDGSQIVTACDDGAARLWDAQSGQLIAEPMRHPGRVTTVSFSPDGRFILARCGDKRDRIWAVPPSAGARAPDWLLRFATIQAGSRIDDNGETVDATNELAGWEALRAEMNALPASAPFAAWAKWVLADAGKRPLAPGFEITLADAEARGLLAAPVTTTLVEERATAPAMLK